MKFALTLAILIGPLSLAAQTKSQSKCDASINGFKIQNVYIMGDNYNAVIWGYKHLSEETCLTPVMDITKADAILELYTVSSGSDSAPASDSVSVSCTSTKDSTACSDSDGNVMTVDCTGSSCTSYYGPDPAKVIGQAVVAWINNSWYAAGARIYTVDHKLLWRGIDTKGDWLGAQWPDKVRLGTNSPVCKVGAFQRPNYKTFRHWASTKCGVEFAPLVSIDLKMQAKQTATQVKQDEKDEMVRNAREAAAKQ